MTGCRYAITDTDGFVWECERERHRVALADYRTFHRCRAWEQNAATRTKMATVKLWSGKPVPDDDPLPAAGVPR